MDDYRFYAVPKRDRTGAVLGMVGVIGLTLLAYSCVRQQEHSPAAIKAQADCHSCHTTLALTKYFKQAGSPTPEQMAHAVMQTESPKLLSAMAVIESGANPKLKNTGFRKRHSGAFQVNPKYWGAVPSDAVGQALQAERILVELTNTMPIEKALAQYGGDSTTKYQRKVLAELVRVP